MQKTPIGVFSITFNLHEVPISRQTTSAGLLTKKNKTYCQNLVPRFQPTTGLEADSKIAECFPSCKPCTVILFT